MNPSENKPQSADVPVSPTKQESVLLSLVLNIVAPTLLLTKGKHYLPSLSAAQILIISLAFPVTYFVWDWFHRKKINPIAIIGFASILLTGGIGLLQLPRTWFLIKEFLIPLLAGLVFLISNFTSRPILRLMLMNDALLEVKKINAVLDEKNAQADFRKLIKQSTWFIVIGFLLSGIINFFVASHIVTVEPADNLQLFNEQIGKTHWVTFAATIIPSMGTFALAMWRVFAGLTKLTGLTLEEMLVADKKS